MSKFSDLDITLDLRRTTLTVHRRRRHSERDMMRALAKYDDRWHYPSNAALARTVLAHPSGCVQVDDDTWVSWADAVGRGGFVVVTIARPRRDPRDEERPCP